MADGFLSDIDSTNATTKNCATTNHSVTTTDSFSSASVYYGRTFADSQFSNELCFLYDDMAELEWLSNFVEESFSTDQSLQTNIYILSGSKRPTPESSASETHPEPLTSNPTFQPETPLPGKARSKRSRAAPCDWSTRLLHVPSATKMSSKKARSGETRPKPKPGLQHHGPQMPPLRSRENSAMADRVRRGPKTLCNACGVRYKSGRLVPEYRPAASPTFVSAKHSNSHRKVLELRRQKEMQGAQQQQFLSQSSIFGASNGGDDFLMRHHSGLQSRARDLAGL
ncbi:GATA TRANSCRIPTION FACTOR [Salix koriyanagi]|uniref:GATA TRANSCRIPTION FACTOR n=1 Tax=Salix koriyanagi TaxID=2511006 RepID=A0A9Q0Q675_9ROSI|nr:GATA TRANSCRIPTION FACTOR [Salix koriyanagi]